MPRWSTSTDAICRASRSCSCRSHARWPVRASSCDALAVEHLGDLRQPEPEFAQQQDPLQPHERVAGRSGGSRCGRCSTAAAGRCRRSGAACGWSCRRSSRSAGSTTRHCHAMPPSLVSVVITTLEVDVASMSSRAIAERSVMAWRDSRYIVLPSVIAIYRESVPQEPGAHNDPREVDHPPGRDARHRHRDRAQAQGRPRRRPDRRHRPRRARRPHRSARRHRSRTSASRSPATSSRSTTRSCGGTTSSRCSATSAPAAPRPRSASRSPARSHSPSASSARARSSPASGTTPGSTPSRATSSSTASPATSRSTPSRATCRSASSSAPSAPTASRATSRRPAPLRKATIDTVSGAMLVDSTGEAHQVGLNTVSGNATVRLDEGYPANYVVRSVSGRVQVDGVVRSGSGTGPTTNFTGSVGELSGSFVDVRANSVSGDITVLRRAGAPARRPPRRRTPPPALPRRIRTRRSGDGPRLLARRPAPVPAEPPR